MGIVGNLMEMHHVQSKILILSQADNLPKGYNLNSLQSWLA